VSQGWSIVRGCASTMRVARASGMAERRQRLGFYVVACLESLNHAPSPAPLFIEHANALCQHKPISTLI
jgi:hypothetical protein